jgi:hypothetical protein
MAQTPPILAALVTGITVMAGCRVLVLSLAADLDLTGNGVSASLARYVMNDFCLGIAALGLAGLVYAGLHLWGLHWEGRVLSDARRGPVPAVWAYLTGSVRDPHDLVRSAGHGRADALTRASDAADHWETIRARRATPLGLIVWSLPLLGFIGTVIGISHAIGGLGAVFATSARDAALAEVLDALRFAFDTTFVGLAAVLPTMAAMQIVRGKADATRRILLRRIMAADGAE